MKSSHGQLGAGLANGLGGHNTHCLAYLHESAVGKVPAVTHGTHTKTRSAGKNRADFHAGHTRLAYPRDTGLVNFLACMDKHFVCKGILDIFKSNAPQHPFFKRLNHFAAFEKGFNLNAHHGAAVMLGNGAVLGHVCQPPCQVSGVSGFKGGVSQPLSGAVS